MASQLNDVMIMVNNVQVGYTADSLEWDDGFGEFQIRNAVLGGDQTEQIFSEVLDSKVGRVKFSMPSTQENDRLKRTWKVNRNNNVVEVIGTGSNNFTKIFTGATIMNDPTTVAASDGNIEIEFKTRPAQ